MVVADPKARRPECASVQRLGELAWRAARPGCLILVIERASVHEASKSDVANCPRGVRRAAQVIQCW